MFLFRVSAQEKIDAFCASVQINISQEATFERQGFEAHMKITNGLDDIDLTELDIEVTFKDADGNVVVASSNPNDTNENIRFFIKLNTDKSTIAGGVDGAGQVPGRTTADIYWTIIPTFDENNVAPNGTKYFIGASMTYKIGGKDEAVTV